jgi:hypothetical protein
VWLLLRRRAKAGSISASHSAYANELVIFGVNHFSVGDEAEAGSGPGETPEFVPERYEVDDSAEFRNAIAMRKSAGGGGRLPAMRNEQARGRAR